MKKAMLVLFLALQFAGVIGIASALQGDPWPECLPCRVAVR